MKFHRKYAVFGGIFFLIGPIAMILMNIHHQKYIEIVDLLAPTADRIQKINGGFLIFSIILIFCSFPPMIGREIATILIGFVYGYTGFVIVLISFIIGETLVFLSFRHFCHTQAIQFRNKYRSSYGVFVKIIEEKKVSMMFLISLSAIPSHFSTPLFATINSISYYSWLLVAIPCSIKHIIPVYVGILFRRNQTSVASTIVLIFSIIITIVFFTLICLRYQEIKKNMIFLNSVSEEQELSQNNILDILDVLLLWIEEIPPETGPKRFGNKAFQKWVHRLENEAMGLLKKHLPEWIYPALNEIYPYFISGFGHGQRLDYGTGHELSFTAFLCGLMLLRFFKLNRDESAIVLKIFNKYFEIVRILIITYNLEPAGSHGVWGLDDHFFLPYVFGSSQLSYVDVSVFPKDILDKNIVKQQKSENLYFGAINFINQVKQGPFFEHSPYLYDISGVEHWKKVNQQGMLKMYYAEVLGKFPVIQHFLFGKAKTSAYTLSQKTKAELEKDLDELKQELLTLRVQKISGGAASKLAKIADVRKSIARIYTVINLKQRKQLQLFYKKKKYLPLDLRPKKTKAKRLALTCYEKGLMTLKAKK
ncbi:hypothetical protein PORY_002282, partial [Pneumocystis oryctolagi]